MEDEDEVLKPVEAPMSSLERPQADKPDSIPEQCDTVLPTGDSPVKNDVASPSTVAEGDEEVKREERENEVTNVEELETDEVEKEVDDSKPVTEELEVKDEEERENEGANVEELESERKEEVIEEESVRKEEELPPVSDELETNQHDEDVNEKVELVEEAEEDMKKEKPESDGEKAVVEMKQEEEDGDSKGEAIEEDNGNELSLPVGMKDEEEMVEEEEEEETPVTMKDEEEEEETPVTMKNEEEEEETPVTMKDEEEEEEETPVTMKNEEEEETPVTMKNEEEEEETPVPMKDEEEEEETPVPMKDEEEEEETPVTMKDEEEEEEETPVTMKNEEEEETPVTMKDEEEDEETPADMKDEEVAEEEEETEVVKSGSGGNGGKRKRGRNAKGNTPVRAPGRKTVGEDVCFICLDGGALVLCDRRGCPKAYHPSCVDHDDEFFKTKGKWNCGWHLCNTCGKNGYFMCYTCTFSLCKGCCKDAVVFCVRGNKGFCESCMKTVMMIENSDQNEMDQVAFDDRSSWEYLFKDYWIEQRKKLCITSYELSQAKSPGKSSDATDKQQTPTVVHEGNDYVETDSDSFLGNQELTVSKRKKVKRKSKSVDSDTDSSSEKEISTPKRKTKRRSKSETKTAHSDSEHSSGHHDTNTKRRKRPRRLSKAHSKQVAAKEGFSADGNVEWASKELLEFVMHMKDGDKSVLTQFDVQGLLLEYIKRNKLRDPRRQSQIICDTMLQKLFGKPRVGHFEMLKLLESHFLLKEDSQADDNHGSVVDEISQLEADDNTDSLMDAGRSKGRKSRKRGEVSYQSNLDDYAAIDMHNINLIYLRRNLMEALMEDSEAFHDKVVGAFVRIRISGSSQKQDIYRLVQIIGTSKAAEPYKFGKRTTDAMLEILNLDKTEVISIDTISNQDFTEDECKRLRQSIKCGLISRMTVGDVLEKARELHEVRVTDWLEAEIVRLSHLRDRASEKGRKRELRECVEKLQLLKTPEERQRRLEGIPEVHADPKMDPSCESDDEHEMDNKRQVSNMRPRDSGSYRRGREPFSARKGGTFSNDSWSANARPPNKSWEQNRNLSGKGSSSRREEIAIASQTSEHNWNNGADKGAPLSSSWEKPSIRAEYSGVRFDMSNITAPEPPQSLSAGVAQTDAKVKETEKIWHYRDPTGKVQGPFSMAQLRKWSNTGYFPADLRIWRALLSEDDSILLAEVLAGRVQKELPSLGLQSDIVSNIRNAPSSIDTSKLSANARGTEYSGRYDSSNLPSTTPSRRPAAGWIGKQASESKWSKTSSPFRTTNQFQGSNERLPSPTPTSPSSDPRGLDRSNFSRQSRDGGYARNREENMTASVGAVQPGSVTHTAAQGYSAPGPRPDVSVNPGTISAQQTHVANQAFAPHDSGMSQTNMGPDAKNVAQGFSGVTQPGTGQNPSVYTHGWASGFVARPEVINANVTPSNPNAVQPQLPYGQWAGGPVSNQASSYGTGYPPGPGNMASNIPAMPSHNAWAPAPTNMPLGGQQQQPVNPNVGWAAPPSAAYGPAGTVPAAMGQIPGTTPGAAAMPSGNTSVGWPGTGHKPSAGNANPGWVASPGNPGPWAGDQNRNGGGAQWNRQSSFGSGGVAPSGPVTPRGQRGVCKFHENGHCRKGASCDYMHT